MGRLEEWKDIEGYENYQVSNLGRVKSFWFGKERILKATTRKDGYLQVVLCKDGKMKNFLVHRLVAMAFIPNPLNLPQINHINEDKTDNRAKNLEWCTAEYNINYGTRTERTSKKVLQYSLDGEIIREFTSTMEVQRQFGFSQGNICQCCNGKLPHAYCYVWRYAE